METTVKRQTEGIFRRQFLSTTRKLLGKYYPIGIDQDYAARSAWNDRFGSNKGKSGKQCAEEYTATINAAFNNAEKTFLRVWVDEFSGEITVGPCAPDVVAQEIKEEFDKGKRRGEIWYWHKYRGLPPIPTIYTWDELR